MDMRTAQEELYNAEKKFRQQLNPKVALKEITEDERTLQACDLALEEVASRHGWIYRRVRTR